MIVVDTYINGFEINGHDRIDVCSVVSYGAWVRMLDINDVDPDCIWFSSGEKSSMGLTYLCSGDEKSQDYIVRFKQELSWWLEENIFANVKIVEHDCNYELKYNYHIARRA